MKASALLLLLCAAGRARAGRFVKSYTQADGVLGLQGAYGVAVSPDDRHVYVASDQGNAMSCMTRSADSGALEFLQTFTNAKIGGVGLQGARCVPTLKTHLLFQSALRRHSGLVGFGGSSALDI